MTTVPRYPGFHPQTQRFLEFHEDNPQVLLVLLGLIRTAWMSGVRRCSIATFYELTRWNLTQEAQRTAKAEGQEVSGKMYAMPNAHKAYYARLLAARYEPLAEFFETSASEADNRTADWIGAAK